MRKLAVSLFVVICLFLTGCKESEEVKNSPEISSLVNAQASVLGNEFITANDVENIKKMSINHRASASAPKALAAGIFKKSPTVFSAVAWAHFPSPVQDLTQNLYLYECNGPDASVFKRIGYDSKFIYNVPAGNRWYASYNRAQISNVNKYVVTISKIRFRFSPYYSFVVKEFYLKDL